MIDVIGRLAALVVMTYVVVSVCSALRMYFVHSRYVHVEFAGKKWRSFGEWAPRQYRRLIGLRWAAVAGLVVWMAIVFVPPLYQ
ncbi:hypothetical protein WM40_04850 [Robbsia andropogonis]|uniref:Uncharacterized protein n=2 Tax=Robbsia andropogonis TaxID=28092 RepID=A0A0F5K453_9BURK|nr:hypothetical protein [Robbsia andropogonis]KKB64715.1 hypothetical protein WM40_04850 [Robbsia andropogonis]MCP1117922.1 hypothetical protein [Robbsia andropogonis]MCP1127387.1 hypothetical protein [Robbsia andropogonis]